MFIKAKKKKKGNSRWKEVIQCKIGCNFAQSDEEKIYEDWRGALLICETSTEDFLSKANACRTNRCPLHP